MKRVGYIYEQMADWTNIVEAEAVSTRRKSRNKGVVRHKESRWSNLCEIQQNILAHNMRTSEYTHEQRVSGQDKLRDIAKLHFHPSHIQHQLLTMAADRRVDKALIRHTYASRKGYGQTLAALHIRDFLRKHRHEELWFSQCDIRKYYEHIPHDLIRKNLSRLFKDKAFVDAFIEPFTKFAPDGKGVPLGIRPSQVAGNVSLMGLDRFATEEVKCLGYIRYLDDFVFFGHTKGEVKRKTRRLKAYVESLGFVLHEPKIHRIREGLDMLGYVFYNTRHDMFWRKSDKRRWLKRRAKVTNPKRRREIDDAAWGMLKWGNSHCKRLFHRKTGDKRTFKVMGVCFNNSGIKIAERKDANGVKFIDLSRVSMDVVKDKPVKICDWAKGITTKHGGGRYALEILFAGERYKLIVNSSDIKTFVDSLERNRVTLAETVFYDRGGKTFCVDYRRTSIIDVEGREVEERDGRIYFKGTDEEIIFT